MIQKITLQLSDDTLNHAQEIASQTGRSVETVLVEWLERAAHDDIGPLDPTVSYSICTPFGGEATARALEEFLNFVP